MARFFRGSGSGCPICGGPAKEVEVSVDFWRGGVEPLTIWVCDDAACAAHDPNGSHDL